MPGQIEGFLGGRESDRAAWVAERLFWVRTMREPALVLVPRLDGLKGLYHYGEIYWGPEYEGAVHIDPVREILQAPANSLDQLSRVFAEALIPQARSRSAREPFWEDSARAILRNLLSCTAYRYASFLSMDSKSLDRLFILTSPQKSATVLLLALYEEIAEESTGRTDSRSMGSLPDWADFVPHKTVRSLKALLSRNSLVTAGSMLSEVSAALEPLSEMTVSNGSGEQGERVFHPCNLVGPLFIEVDDLSPETLGLLLLSARMNGVESIFAFELDKWSEELLPAISTKRSSISWTAQKPSSAMVKFIMDSTSDIMWGFAFDSANKICFTERVRTSTGQPGGLLTSQPYEEPAQLPEGMVLRHDGISWRIDRIPETDSTAVEFVCPRKKSNIIPFLELIPSSQEVSLMDDEDDETPVL